MWVPIWTGLTVFWDLHDTENIFFSFSNDNVRWKFGCYSTDI